MTSLSDDPEGGLILGLQGEPMNKTMGFSNQAPSSHANEASGRIVRYRGENHLLTFGVTGSSKTTGPVITNALTHPGSLISIECRGDVYAATADRRRAMGQPVITLDLRGGDTTGGSFNPIDGIRLLGGGTTLTARSLAAALVPRVSTLDVFWSNWAEFLLTGGIAYMIDHLPTEQQNLSWLFDLFNNDDVNYRLATILDKHAGKLDRSTYAAFAGYLQLSERETRPSVLGSTTQHLMLWEADFIRNVTASTSFDLHGLVAGAPMSLYVIVPAIRMSAYSTVVRLWLSSLLSALMTRQRPPEHRTLMLVDEIGAIGPVDAFVTATTLARSSGVQLWSFWQNTAQLEIYGAHARTLVDNAGVHQFLGARNQRMADDVGADSNLSHRADRILSQGWKPTLRGSAVDKFSS